MGRALGKGPGGLLRSALQGSPGPRTDWGLTMQYPWTPLPWGQGCHHFRMLWCCIMFDLDGTRKNLALLVRAQAYEFSFPCWQAMMAWHRGMHALVSSKQWKSSTQGFSFCPPAFPRGSIAGRLRARETRTFGVCVQLSGSRAFAGRRVPSLPGPHQHVQTHLVAVGGYQDLPGTPLSLPRSNWGVEGV